jgi:hypothetical protein
VQEIVRSEVRLAKTELREEAAKVKTSGVLLGAGALLGLYAGGFLLLGTVYVLATILPAWAAAFIVALTLALVAGFLLSAGRKRAPTNPSYSRANSGKRKGECRMGQTTDQIEHHIEQTRETLGSNLQELEYKVKAVTD